MNIKNDMMLASQKTTSTTQPNGELRSERMEHSTVTNAENPSETVPQTPILDGDDDIVQHQVMSFMDNTPKSHVEFAPVVDPTFVADELPSQELADFLSRPVLIRNYIWPENGGTSDQIRPWSLFFNDTVIKKKIDNYAFINCNLHIKAVINASPFYYGALLLSYEPLPQFRYQVGVTSNINYVEHSQRPHILVMPQTNQGGEMTLPFFYFKNWLALTSFNDVNNMGILRTDVIQNLRNSQGATGGTIEVKIYAWATNVRLCGPTLSAALQAGDRRKGASKAAKAVSGAADEYGKGPVSKIASAVANSAGALSDVPYIGPFAKATEIGASAVSKVASIFGFTNVPVISPVMPFKGLPFHSLASADIGEPVQKLTLDPKNELTIDPRTTGLGVGDELNINYICSKESILTVIPWTSGNDTDTLLFDSNVSPVLFNVEPISGNAAANGGWVNHQTPMSMVSQLFRYWRGDIIFRIKAICTKYHKGRLRLTWDPVADIGAVGDNETTCYTRIVDLSPDMDLEVRCSYLQARHFLTCSAYQNTNFWSTDPGGGVITPNANFSNGLFTIRVLNRLTGPVTSADVSLIIYVRAADNVQFMNPINQIDPVFSHFVPQAGDLNRDGTDSASLWHEVGPAASLQSGNTPVDCPETYHVYGGEAVGSLRMLMRRSYADTSVFFDPIDNTSTLAIQRINQLKLPKSPGYDGTGPLIANSVKVPPNPLQFGYSAGYMTPLVWILPAFVGWRGSMIWHYNIDTTSKTRQAISSLRAERVEATVPKSGSQLRETNVASLGTSTNTAQKQAFMRLNSGNASGGISLTNTLTQSGLSVSYPHYYPYRFAAAGQNHWCVGIDEDETGFKHNRISWTVKPAVEGNPNVSAVALHRFYSIGTDFNSFFFLNAPLVYQYSSIPEVTGEAP